MFYILFSSYLKKVPGYLVVRGTVCTSTWYLVCAHTFLCDSALNSPTSTFYHSTFYFLRATRAPLQVVYMCTILQATPFKTSNPCQKISSCCIFLCLLFLITSSIFQYLTNHWLKIMGGGFASLVLPPTLPLVAARISRNKAFASSLSWWLPMSNNFRH